MAKKEIKEKREIFECYYMAQEELNVGDIANVLLESMPGSEKKVQLWTEAGVLEYEVSEAATITLEEQPEFRDEEDLKFISKKGIKKVFFVSTDGAGKGEVRKLFAPVIEKHKGIVCSDTPDFLPIISS